MRQKTRQEKIVKNAPQAQEPLFDQKTFFAINNALNLYESRRLKILLDKPEGQKAAFHGRFQKGETALQIALKNHRQGHVRLLLPHTNGAVSDLDGFTALHEAAKRWEGDPLVLKALADLCDPTAKTQRGYTALMIAAFQLNQKAVKVLAPVSDCLATNEKGQDALAVTLDNARWSGHAPLAMFAVVEHVVEALAQKGQFGDQHAAFVRQIAFEYAPQFATHGERIRSVTEAWEIRQDLLAQARKTTPGEPPEAMPAAIARRAPRAL